ncbi:MAG: hypothetical protein EU548_06590 [Promethearchaeota archaeon]|nr:MAG: hypothetical protein EU548_06590 [Candidatus Lokiarchaeota archaeon]
MSDEKNNLEKSDFKEDDPKIVEISESTLDQEEEKEAVEKDFVPHFFPTFRINRKLYSVPILLVVILSGILAYLTYFVAGIREDAGYIPETQFGAIAGILNGVIFTALAGVSAFILIYFVKKKGINVLKYVFGFSFGLLGFFLTVFFGEIIIFILLGMIPLIVDIGLYIIVAILSLLMLYAYFTTESVFAKDAIVLYIGLLTGAMLGVVMPLWTTLAILIGISLWDIFAVLYKKGPIKEMIDLASNSESDEEIEDAEEKVKRGEAEYDTSKLEIGIGDLAFYSMLTSSALIQTGNLFVMIFTSIAIIAGTGITISGLSKNKILPGLPISIFLGIGTMLLSWLLFITF